MGFQKYKTWSDVTFVEVKVGEINFQFSIKFYGQRSIFSDVQKHGGKKTQWRTLWGDLYVFWILNNIVYGNF